MIEQTPNWLGWARQIYSIAKSGLTYSESDYDIDRYKHLMEIAAEMLASQGELSKGAIQQSFSMQSGYATPKIDVRGAVFRDGKILLVQERADGKWALPGGWADLGDLPSAMIEREVREESGLNVKAVKVAAIYDANHIQPFEFYTLTRSFSSVITLMVKRARAWRLWLLTFSTRLRSRRCPPTARTTRCCRRFLLISRTLAGQQHSIDVEE